MVQHVDEQGDIKRLVCEWQMRSVEELNGHVSMWPGQCIHRRPSQIRTLAQNVLRKQPVARSHVENGRTRRQERQHVLAKNFDSMAMNMCAVKVPKA
jgi:hypothetical protein